MKRRVRPIAIDIGQRTLRLAQAAVRGNSIQLVARAWADLPETFSDKNARSVHLQNEIVRLLREGGFRGKEIIGCLPDSIIEAKNLRLPPMPDDELAGAVQFEAAERFGFGPDGGKYRFVTAGDVRSGSEIRKEVIVMGVRSEAIGAYLDFWSRMKLDLVAIDVVPCAVLRSMERFIDQQDEDATHAFVDIGHTASRVVITRGSEITFVKIMNLGGKDLLEAVPADEDQASENLPRGIRQSAFEQLTKEIGLCLRYHAVTFRGRKPEMLTCTGSSARSTELLEAVSRSVKIPALPGRPLRGLGAERFFENKGRGEDDTCDWATAIGMALKPITVTAGQAA